MSKKSNFYSKNGTLNKVFPFLLWIGELKNKKVLKADLVAGITVALVLVPQSMAYAKLAELPLTVGLYTAFIPVVLAALFGSSRQMSTGPVTIVSLMTATALAPIAISGTAGYIAYASILALFIGFFYLFLGIIRGGIIVEFLSHPVITGFTNAVAIITIISQLPKIFGVNKPTDFGHYLDYIYQIFGNIFSSADIATLLIGTFSIGGLLFMKKFTPKLPRILVLLIASIIITATLYKTNSTHDLISTVKVVGEIKGGFPDLSFPFLHQEVFNGTILDILSTVKHLAMYAIIIGLIGFTESISVAKFVGAKTKQRVSANRELLGQGVANISSGLFGGMGVAGSFSKTAVNLKAGAQTGFSSIVTGVIVGITILFLTPLLYYLPIATLSAIIIVAVFDLIKIQPLITAWKIETHDGIVGLFTFIVTLSLTPSIELGILFGVLLSLLFYIYRSMRPRFVEVGMYKDGLYRDIEKFGLKASKHISVFRFDSSLYFANAGYFESQVLEFIAQKKKIKYIIFDMEWVANIDSSGLEVLKELISDLQDSGTKVYLTSIRVKVLQKLYKAGFIKKFGKKNIFITIQDALNFINEKKKQKVQTKNLENYVPDKTLEGEEDIETKIIEKYIRD